MNAMTTTSYAFNIDLVETKHVIPPRRMTMREWKRLPSDLRRHTKDSVEQHLGVQAFHLHLHETNTPHWIERRDDGVYLLWGEHAENSALMPGWSMKMPIGTRIEG